MLAPCLSSQTELEKKKQKKNIQKQTVLFEKLGQILEYVLYSRQKKCGIC